MHVFVTVNTLMEVISRMTALTGFHKDPVHIDWKVSWKPQKTTPNLASLWILEHLLKTHRIELDPWTPMDEDLARPSPFQHLGQATCRIFVQWSGNLCLFTFIFPNLICRGRVYQASWCQLLQRGGTKLGLVWWISLNFQRGDIRALSYQK